MPIKVNESNICAKIKIYTPLQQQIIFTESHNNNGTTTCHSSKCAPKQHATPPPHPSHPKLIPINILNVTWKSTTYKKI
jgi:hypothetical protein